MAILMSNDVSEALRLLIGAAMERRNVLSSYERASAPVESDDENDSSSPVFHSFYNSERISPHIRNDKLHVARSQNSLKEYLRACATNVGS